MQAPSGEQLDIPRALATKTPVGADGDGGEGRKGGGEFGQKGGGFLLRTGEIERQGDGEANLPALEEAKFVGKAGDEGGMFFGMEDGKGMIAESEDGGGGRRVGRVFAQNDPLVAEVKPIEEAEGEVAQRRAGGRGRKGFGKVHVRRMREISGREIRWRAR